MLPQPYPTMSHLMAAEAQARPEQEVYAPEQATEAELVELVRRRYEYSRDSKTEMLETWATALSFFVGDQWRRWDDKSRRLVKQTRIPSWRVLATYNQLPGIVDLAAAKLSRARELPRCRPDEPNDPQDRERAKRGTQAIRSWWHREEMDLQEHEVNVNRILFGDAFEHLYWDPGAFAKVPMPQGFQTDETGAPVLDEMGQPVPRVVGVQAPVGDVRSEVLTVFDVFPDPCERYLDSQWVIIARRKPLQWFQDTFGAKGAEVREDQADQSGVFASLIPGFDGRGQSGNNAGAPEGEGMATLKICYEKPCKRYPRGRTLYVAGETLLLSRDALPLPHQGLRNPLPVKKVGYRYVPKRLWCKGLIEECISPQRELNRGLGRISELLRLYSSPKRWIDKNWKVKPNAITSAPDEVIEGDFGAQNPVAYVESPPALPAWVSNYPSLFREELRHTANQNEISEGSVPGGVTAASAIALLQQSENQRLSSPALLGKIGLEDFARHLLCVMDERYREPRMVTVPLRRDDQETAIIPPHSFGPLEVVVEMADGVEDTDTFRQEQAMAWINAGLLQMPPQMATALLQGVGQTWLADILAEVAPQLEMQAAMQAMQQQEQQAALQQEQVATEDRRRQEDRQAQVEDREAQMAAQQEGQQAQAQAGLAQTAMRALLSGQGQQGGPKR